MPESKNYSRTVTLERESVDVEAGTFEAVLATDGEATDGHILSIEGGKIPARMPMQLAHSPSPLQTVGSITHPRKDVKSSPKTLRVRGELELNGEGAQASIRRDLLHMMERGHVRAMSVSWEALQPPVARVDLDPTHPAFVNGEKEKDFRKRYGLFFPKWRALEGSIVAVGADPDALVGRTEEGEMPEVERQLWRSFAANAESLPGEREAEEPLGYLVDVVSWARERGVTNEDLIDALRKVPARSEEIADPFEAGSTPADSDTSEEDEGGCVTTRMGDRSITIHQPGCTHFHGGDASEDSRATGEPAATGTEEPETEPAPSGNGREIPESDEEETGITDARVFEILREELGGLMPSMREMLAEVLDERLGRVR